MNETLAPESPTTKDETPAQGDIDIHVESFMKQEPARTAQTEASPQEAAEEASKEESKEESKVMPWDRLRQAREAAGLDIKDIASLLRLDFKLVRALEKGDMDELPQPVYIAGYVRAYAKRVGLPPEELVHEYVPGVSVVKIPTLTADSKETGDMPARFRQVSHVLPRGFSMHNAAFNLTSVLRYVVTAAVVAVVLVVVWQSADNKNADFSDMENIANLDDVEASLAVPIPEPQSDGEAKSKTQTSKTAKTTPKTTTAKTSVEQKPSAPAPAAAIQQPPVELLPGQSMAQFSVNFSENSWIDIKDARGERLIRELGVAGASKTLSGVPPFDVLLGYGPGVNIQYQGEDLDISRFQGARVTRFSMDPLTRELHALTLPDQKPKSSENTPGSAAQQSLGHESFHSDDTDF